MFINNGIELLGLYIYQILFDYPRMRNAYSSLIVLFNTARNDTSYLGFELVSLMFPSPLIVSSSYKIAFKIHRILMYLYIF